MALFAISDLHLSSDNKKTMEVFGPKWVNYMERIRDNWEQNISPNDTVIIPGDVSWATYLEESTDDFRYIDSLPGNKIIFKGNHDYWWTTQSKLYKYLKENEFTTISFMHNNSFLYENILICGTRGWICPGVEGFTQEDEKIFKREVDRLRLSLESGKDKEYDKIIAALHYPPFCSKAIDQKIAELFNEYKVDLCIYGHLHGYGHREAVEGVIDGVEYKMVGADYLNFVPLKLA